jgi:hypothetical protein
MASPFAEAGYLTDKALVAGMRKLFTGKEPLLKFAAPRPVVHDLRRTCEAVSGASACRRTSPNDASRTRLARSTAHMMCMITWPNGVTLSRGGDRTSLASSRARRTSSR